MTENEKAKFQNPFTYNDQRNFVRVQSCHEKLSDDLVYLTKSDTSSASDTFRIQKKGRKLQKTCPAPAEDLPATTPTPAPAPAPADTLEAVEGQPYTPGSRKSTKKEL